MINLYELSREGIDNLLKDWGEPSYRAKQVYEWLYAKPVDNFDKMSNLPKSLRERLQTETTLGSLELVLEQNSKRDGTAKRLYRLADGQLIESVLMPYDDNRRTACISSQAGCAMGCVF